MNDQRHTWNDRRIETDGDGSHGHPIDHPIASGSQRPTTTVNTSSVVTNDGAQQGTTPPPNGLPRRVTATALAAIADRLSDRDRTVLASIAEHRFLTVRQIQALHFTDHAPTSGGRIARRTLARLRGFGLLGTLERRVGGVRAGSAGLVHYLDDAGHHLLHGSRRHRVQDPSERFVSHRLAIADAHIGLVSADRDGAIELVECTVEPASWRRYTGFGGARVTLKPDLYVETAVGRELVHAWFIEVDLGTESIPTLLRKCHDYESYRRVGTEQVEHGSFPLVVWSVTHHDPVKAERRRDALRQAITADRALLVELFRIVTPQQLTGALQHRGQQ
jgi:hypothetical protein